MAFSDCGARAHVLLNELGLVFVDAKFVHLAFDCLIFFDENAELLGLDAHDLRTDPLMEGKVVDEGVLGVDLHLGVVHLPLEAFLLALKVLLRLQGHADLGELEDNLEVREEVEESGGVLSVGDLFEELAFVLLHVHVDLLGNLVDPLLLVVGGVAVLHLVGEDVGVDEDILAFLLVGGGDVLGDELADEVEDVASGCPARAIAVKHDPLDLLERVSVAALKEAGPGFVHRRQDLVDAVELLVGLHHAALLHFNAVHEVLFGDLALILLVLDLRIEEKTRSDSEHDSVNRYDIICANKEARKEEESDEN